MSDRPLTPFPVFTGADYDGCKFALVDADYDVDGWQATVLHWGTETKLYPFELGTAGEISKGRLTVIADIAWPEVPAWVAFMGRGQLVRLVDPQGSEYEPTWARLP